LAGIKMSEKIDNHIDFLTVREEVNEYKIPDDNSTIKMKVTLIDLRKKEIEGQFSFYPQAVFTKTDTPSDLKKPEEQESSEEQTQAVGFQAVVEPINIYDIPGKFILLIKPFLTNVMRSNRFDGEGKRVYTYKIDCLVNVVSYPEFKTKPVVEPVSYSTKSTYSPEGYHEV
jgi:hypothetical protein